MTYRKITHKAIGWWGCQKKLVQFLTVLKLWYKEGEVVLLLYFLLVGWIWAVVFIGEGCGFGRGGQRPVLGEDWKPWQWSQFWKSWEYLVQREKDIDDSFFPFFFFLFLSFFLFLTLFFLCLSLLFVFLSFFLRKKHWLTGVLVIVASKY